MLRECEADGCTILTIGARCTYHDGAADGADEEGAPPLDPDLVPPPRVVVYW